MHNAASKVEAWIISRDSVSPIRDNSRAAVVKLAVDSTESTAHFVRKIHSAMARRHKIVSDVPEEKYPADWIENIVAAVQSDGGHPVLVINRFHAFASIADGNLLSVLSMLRQLEHDGNLTTIAISPMNYQMIRQDLSVKGHFPFVNSAYGDNHDQAVMPPLTRSEFVAAAAKVGLPAKRSNPLFAECGGPDCVHHALLSSAISADKDVVERAVREVGTRLDSFFDIVLGSGSPDTDDLRFRMATGQLLPPQVAYLRHQDLSAFLMKEGPRGKMIAASPVVARLLLQGREGPWVAYSKVLEAVESGQYGDATRQISLLNQDSAHLKVFARLLEMLAALYSSQSGGLLEMDWRTARRIGHSLLASGLPVDPYRNWIEQIVRWSQHVSSSIKEGQGGGARFDVLAQQANSADVQKLILYAIGLFLNRVRRSGSPGERVRAAASVPEALFQAMSAYLGIDPLKAPESLPDHDYQAFFGGLDEYQRPKPGTPLDLTHLLVIVPAILSDKCAAFKDEIAICNPSYVKPLHQTLVARMRNATAHTYSEMDETQAKFFFDLCGVLVADATTVWGRTTKLDSFQEPDSRALAHLFAGNLDSVPDGDGPTDGER
ncbi:hypothetical protein ACFYE8_26505 [Rhizobium leguminosarum]|uniref:hypothetical protein n=1 Tax=Rhizobium leguminosarum TaxID=384 RepID=UPI0036DA9E6B